MERLKLLRKYPKEEFSLDQLKIYGVKSIRGPRSVPKKLSEKLNQK